MTTLATGNLDADQLDLLALVADTQTPIGQLHADDFRTSCEAVADHDGYVNPNLVSAHLHARFGDVNPRWLSAQWSASCSKNGFLDKTDRWVPIDGRHSKGNSNKRVMCRRLRDR